MAQAYAAFANEGLMPEAHLLHEFQTLLSENADKSLLLTKTLKNEWLTISS